MVEFLTSWLGQLVALATAVGVLYAIFRMGHEVGVRDGKQEGSQRVNVLEAQIEVAHRDADTWRSQALVWKSRHEEAVVSPTGNLAQQKLEEVRKVVADGKSIWLRPTIDRISPVQVGDGGPPIITVGNLKGGVGKTTLATHLAAYFAETLNVLFIDLDYQGTGSSQLLRAAAIVNQGQSSRAQLLLQAFSDYTTLQTVPLPLGQFSPKLSVVSAHYALADFEEALMLKWMIGDEPGDIRYNLSKALQSAAFRFDLAIIDAPPRLTTAMAQALAASTHVLIPTQLERKSTEAALYFASIVRTFGVNAVNPRLSLLGVVPNMVQRQTGYSDQEKIEVSYLAEELAKAVPGGPHIWESTPIYDKIAFSRPNLVFHSNDQGAQEAASAIRQLGKEVARRLGIEM